MFSQLIVKPLLKFCYHLSHKLSACKKGHFIHPPSWKIPGVCYTYSPGNIQVPWKFPGPGKNQGPWNFPGHLEKSRFRGNFQGGTLFHIGQAVWGCLDQHQLWGEQRPSAQEVHSHMLLEEKCQLMLVCALKDGHRIYIYVCTVISRKRGLSFVGNLY